VSASDFMKLATDGFGPESIMRVDMETYRDLRELAIQLEVDAKGMAPVHKDKLYNAYAALIQAMDEAYSDPSTQVP